MSRLKQYNPGGVLLPSDLNGLEDDYETAFSTYRSIQTSTMQQFFVTSANTSNFYLVNSGSVPPVDFGLDEMWLDPADWASSGRTARLRVKMQIICNGTAPGISFTAGLYSIATFGGGSGSNPTIATLGGSAVSGSTATVTTPAAGTQTVAIGTDFNAPSAGWYALVIATSGTPAASSGSWGHVQLQMRQT